MKLAPKPSDAVMAMILGLEEQSKREDFVIDMESFGMRRKLEGRGIVCLGCAATCALQKMTGINLTEDVICGNATRAEALKMQALEMEVIEIMFDRLRQGDSYLLFTTYGVNPSIVPPFNLPCLYSHNWRDGLPEFKAFYNFLIQHYL